MKFPNYEAARTNNIKKVPSAESKMHCLKVSPVKERDPIKPQCPPTGVTTVVLLLNNDSSGLAHDKENSTDNREHGRTLDERFEDSGYLSLQNSQNEGQHMEAEDDHIQGRRTEIPPPSPAVAQEKKMSPKQSPIKCQGRTRCRRSMSLVAASTPVDRPRRKTAAYLPSSGPSDLHNTPDLPLLNFQRAVCEELAKSYQKNKRYDWTIVSKVAEDHLLDRVIGGHMGLEYIDVFSSLLSRNMRSILTNILALLGGMDLISCKKVSRSWRKIICEDAAALRRCQQAEQTLRESMTSLGSGCGLTRDVGVSRVVLSCMQTLSSPSTQSISSSSSIPGCRGNRRAGSSNKGSAPNPQYTRFTEYVQAASCLKQHESLRSCKRCGSPATYSSESQRATCTRSSCLFDFCTRCQEAFHGSTPCRVVQPRTHFPTSKSTPLIPGSARSKKNIRRL